MYNSINDFPTFSWFSDKNGCNLHQKPTESGNSKDIIKFSKEDLNFLIRNSGRKIHLHMCHETIIFWKHISIFYRKTLIHAIVELTWIVKLKVKLYETHKKTVY